MKGPSDSSGRPAGPSDGRNGSSEAGGDSFVPKISLQKGGGAIRPIGEKFAANPVTGTGSMSVPIATSTGRAGFGPQLSLSYDSGAGNSEFGFGWNLSNAGISRKTDKGLPQYLDTVDSDVFLLSGAEDLVPIYRQDTDGSWIAAHPGFTVEQGSFWVRDPQGRMVIHEDDEDGYRVRRYRPRIEGLFARIERWSNIEDASDVHWRSISKDNILTLYGLTANSRIFDPSDPTKIFSWLICETRDDKGNAILYHYKTEDGVGIDLTEAHQRNRGALDDPRRAANRYLKRIHYGNRTTLLDSEGNRPRLLDEAQVNQQIADGEWMFEVVFDYGDHDSANPTPQDDQRVDASGSLIHPWPSRPDAFSTFRSGFEVRTARLCQRVLMFHHFAEVPEVGRDCLVKSTDFRYEPAPPDVSTPSNYVFLSSVAHTSYRREDGGYAYRSLPPVEFTYSQPRIDSHVETLDPLSRENLPVGVDGSTYRWADLHGEGLSGIVTQQAGGLMYKRNLSPLGSAAQFAPLETVAQQPNLSLNNGAELMDLAGDGQPDLVVMDGPAPGFFEHDQAEGWLPFRPFQSRLNRNFQDPNLRFIDLNGDGQADILITEDNALVWHASWAKEGFGPAKRVIHALDEEQGPRIVFADGTQSIHLADLSGDGLTDIVRIRNGEICYWPNLGYGKFGPKIAMDNAPRFDHVDQFDARRIRLADIDGSGTTDVIYLHRDGVRLYFNQSGNRWSEAQPLEVFPRVDDLVSITTVDLLGNGTACLVWSSSLPGDAHHPLRYVRLMADGKPHLLVKVRNNLGAETEIEYAPSTYFYLQDKLAGQPWLSKLPFPVHCVKTVTVSDQWRGTRFASSYSYHHGYFDGPEREFRGFGRVEQVDIEAYGKPAAGDPISPYVTDDRTLYQPPVKTVTWFHTGLFIDRVRVLSQFQQEYFLPTGFTEHPLPEPSLAELDLNEQEWREALRACKGRPLRQEVYELDLDAWVERGEERRVKLFTCASTSCHLQRLQPQAQNRHAVFLTTDSEALTYHYELDLTRDIPPDPRSSHVLNLRYDSYGNPLQAVTAVYARRGEHQDDTLAAADLQRIRRVQKETHLAYAETRYTTDIDQPRPGQDYRLRVPCEVMTFELTGITPNGEFFTADQLRAYHLSPVHQSGGVPVTQVPYHRHASPGSPAMRLVEHVRTLFFNETLDGPLTLGQLERKGLTFETYKLALTDDLLQTVLNEKITEEVLGNLNNERLSGYLTGEPLRQRFGDRAHANEYWIRSGIAGFANDAREHFYLPERYTDAFGEPTELEFDPLDLYLQFSRDPVGNTLRVEAFDYRVLAPTELLDINRNRSRVAFDILGLPIAAAVMGKGTEADNLEGFTSALTDPAQEHLNEFFTAIELDQLQAQAWLSDATARHLYYFGETTDSEGNIIWGAHPPCAATILRERHVADVEPGEQSPLQIAFEYSDGHGNVLVKKAQAEPEAEGRPLRWLASGKTVLNNKGKPVLQYEPYFSQSGHRFDAEEAERGVGVTPIMYYDAAGRLIRTEMPDGSYSRVEFSPWQVTSYDQNDTVLEPGNRWYTERAAVDHRSPLLRGVTGRILVNEGQRAAWLAAQHANTPAVVILDTLGREVISIDHNRYLTPGHDYLPVEEKYLTFTRLDAEGKPLWIRDARGNLVMQYIYPPKPTRWAAEANEDMPTGSVPCYDIAGNLLYQYSMDGGDRWMLMDATGQPFYAWDRNGIIDGDGSLRDEEHRTYHTEYDELRRPLRQWLQINGGSPLLLERFEHGDQPDLFPARPAGEVTEAEERNLRGQVYRHFDPSGLINHQQFDYKGNLLHATRQLTQTYDQSIIDWTHEQPEAETFTKYTKYDALNRMSELQNWHRQQRSPAVYVPHYNQRGILAGESLTVSGQTTQAIVQIEYNEKGQRTRIQYGNNTSTRYDYDPHTFRLRQLRTTRTSPGDRLPTPPSRLRDNNTLQNLYYTYDPAGNITEIVDDAFKSIFFRNQQVDPKNEYTYDALYRLIAATGREHYRASGIPKQFADGAPPLEAERNSDQALRNYTQHYHYDAVGNINFMRHQANGGDRQRGYTYAEDSNRLLRTVTGSENPEPVDYRYDIHGSMLNLNRAPKEFNLRWDYRDMIFTANLGNGRAFYNYDANKQRTRKRVKYTSNDGGHIRERIYLEGTEISRCWTLAGDKAEPFEEIETHHLFADDQRVLMVEDVLSTNRDLPAGPLYRYQYGNHLGSVGLEMSGGTDPKIISYEEYHPYGTTAYHATNTQVMSEAKRYRYTGMERDEETGLSYHTARFYLAWLGRWCSADRMAFRDGKTDLSEDDKHSLSTNTNPISHIRGNVDFDNTEENPSSTNGQYLFDREQINLYSYARGNPTGFFDQSGYSSSSVLSRAAVALARQFFRQAGTRTARRIARTINRTALRRMQRDGIPEGIFEHVLEHTGNVAGKAAHGLFREGLDSRQITQMMETTLERGLTPVLSERGGRLSFVIEREFTEEIGTSGERILRVVVDTEGRIITAFPVRTLTARISVNGLSVAVGSALAIVSAHLTLVTEAAQAHYAEREEREGSMDLEDWLLEGVGLFDPTGIVGSGTRLPEVNWEMIDQDTQELIFRSEHDLQRSLSPEERTLIRQQIIDIHHASLAEAAQ